MAALSKSEDLCLMPKRISLPKNLRILKMKTNTSELSQLKKLVTLVGPASTKRQVYGHSV
jgi:hypothetical protein